MVYPQLVETCAYEDIKYIDVGTFTHRETMTLMMVLYNQITDGLLWLNRGASLMHDYIKPFCLVSTEKYFKLNALVPLAALMICQNYECTGTPSSTHDYWIK